MSDSNQRREAWIEDMRRELLSLQSTVQRQRQHISALEAVSRRHGTMLEAISREFAPKNFPPDVFTRPKVLETISLQHKFAMETIARKLSPSYGYFNFNEFELPKVLDVISREHKFVLEEISTDFSDSEFFKFDKLELPKVLEAISRQHNSALEAISRGFAPSYFRFDELPKELRVMIWKYACIPRVITMDWRPSSNEIYKGKLVFFNSRFTTSQLIPISAVCKESRQVFEKDYQRFDNYLPTESVAPKTPIGSIYINCQIDTILVPPNYAYERAVDLSLLHQVNGLRYLATFIFDFPALLFDTSNSSRIPPCWTLQVLDKLPHLEELLIIGSGLPHDDGVPGQIEPYENKNIDVKFVALGTCNDTMMTRWEMIMSEISKFHDNVKENYPALASLKLNLAGLQQSRGPGDYEPNYIKMGPAEEPDRREERFLCGTIEERTSEDESSSSTSSSEDDSSSEDEF